jgi:hypothetical protein
MFEGNHFEDSRIGRLAFVLLSSAVAFALGAGFALLTGIKTAATGTS